MQFARNYIIFINEKNLGPLKCYETLSREVEWRNFSKNPMLMVSKKEGKKKRIYSQHLKCTFPLHCESYKCVFSSSIHFICVHARVQVFILKLIQSFSTPFSWGVSGKKFKFLQWVMFCATTRDSCHILLLYLLPLASPPFLHPARKDDKNSVPV